MIPAALGLFPLTCLNQWCKSFRTQNGPNGRRVATLDSGAIKRN